MLIPGHDETAELWSLPWHQLQRSLAAGGLEPSGSLGMNTWTKKRVRVRSSVAAPSGSWLIMARRRMLESRDLS